MRNFAADLHIHSLLSPCAAVEMTPRNIVWHAAAKKLDVIAITDHNACDNVAAALVAAQDAGITVLPGMEVETREEAHFIVLFDKMRQLKEWERFVAAHRPPLKNNDEKFGAQFIVDAEDNFAGIKEELLLCSLTINAAQLSAKVRELEGLLIASHVDRPAYSIISQLGFIPPDLALDAVEVSRRIKRNEAAIRVPVIGNYPVVTASDAHTIEDFVSGPMVNFFLAEPTVAEIRQALLGVNGRKVTEIVSS
jgi:PHP family Zn ribbon phosphoesterase